MKKFFKFLLIAILVVGFWLGMDFVSIRLLGLISGIPLSDNKALLEYAVANIHFKLALQWIITIALLFIFYKLREKRLSISQKPYLKNQGFLADSWKMVIVGWGYAFFGLLLTGILLNILAGNPINFETLHPVNVFDEFALGDVILFFVCMAVIVPLGEELYFRGVLFRESNLLYKLEPAMILSSLIFGIIHFNIGQSINAFFLGLTLSYVYYKRANITDAIIVHVVNNFIALFVNINIITYYIAFIGGLICFIFAIKILRDMKHNSVNKFDVSRETIKDR